MTALAVRRSGFRPKLRQLSVIANGKRWSVNSRKSDSLLRFIFCSVVQGLLASNVSFIAAALAPHLVVNSRSWQIRR
jgi:hypothetical protein